MKSLVLFAKITVAIFFCLVAVFVGNYFLSLKEQTILVEKYSWLPTEEKIENLSLSESQYAASIKYNKKSYGRTSRGISPVSTAAATGTGTTTKKIVLPIPVIAPKLSESLIPVNNSQKIINGIAAGGVLTGMSEAQLRNYFNELKKLGIVWVRWDMDWSEIQKDGPTRYNWSGSDLVAKILKEYNLQSLVILGYAPKWAGEVGCVPDNHCSPQDAQIFANFATQAALRYKGTIKNWEIWNEQNSRAFWSPKPSVEKYSEVLKASYAAIKTVDPTATVITGGLSPVEGSSSTIEPVKFVTKLYALNSKDSFDAIALHPYAYPLSPASTQPWNYWFQMYKVYDIMNINGDAKKDIWITEYGAPTGGSGDAHELKQLNFFSYGKDYMSENAQATMMSDVISEVTKIDSWVGPVFWYSLLDTNSTSADPEGHFGLITSGYEAYKSAYFKLLNSGN